MTKILKFKSKKANQSQEKRLACGECAYFVRKSPRRAYCRYDENREYIIAPNQAACKQYFEL